MSSPNESESERKETAGVGGGGAGEVPITERKVKRRSKEEGGEGDVSRYRNPFCEVEAAASMKCLHDNGHVRDKCLAVFQEYRDCKKKHREEQREKVKNLPFF